MIRSARRRAKRLALVAANPSAFNSISRVDPSSGNERTLIEAVAAIHARSPSKPRERQAQEERYLRGVARENPKRRPFRHDRQLPPDKTLGLPARPPGVSRQVHRAGFRAACKAVGVDYRDAKRAA